MLHNFFFGDGKLPLDKLDKLFNRVCLFLLNGVHYKVVYCHRLRVFPPQESHLEVVELKGFCNIILAFTSSYFVSDFVKSEGG